MNENVFFIPFLFFQSLLVALGAVYEIYKKFRGTTGKDSPS